MTCRVAIIGLGMVARLHIQAVNSLSGFQVYGLFSRDESKTQDFAEKYAKGGLGTLVFLPLVLFYWESPTSLLSWVLMFFMG
ncbi:MAG: hypothetical protein EBX20_10230, partial [Rhodobacterales bacterium]|nr:hypothetical protein [Rhodobacterales bacterium]